LDKPAAMVALFGSAANEESCVPVEVAVRVFHERLIKRLGAFRGAWSDEAIGSAIIATLDEIAATDGCTRSAASIILLVGSRVIAVAVAGGRFCLSDPQNPLTAQIAGERFKNIEHNAWGHDAMVVVAQLAGKASHPLAGTMALWQPFFAVLLFGPSNSSHCSGLGAEANASNKSDATIFNDDAEILRLVVPHLGHGRPRAASVALLQAAHIRGAAGPLAAACVRLSGADAVCQVVPEHAAKKRKMASAPNKVRVRQILLRHWRGVGAKPVDPIRRKNIDRTPEDAETQMLAVLNRLLTEGCAGFSSSCKSLSECQSALKGGELIGDLGWLDRINDTGQDKKTQHPVPAIRSIVPATVRKAAFELDVGELSDLVSSDVGVHLLMRTA